MVTNWKPTLLSENNICDVSKKNIWVISTTAFSGAKL